MTAKGVDADRVYVAGLSAGAAMSTILGATYPDRFAAIGVVAGAPYGSATSFAETYTVGQSGSPDPAKLGDQAKAAMGAFARPVPVLVFHGTADGLLNVKNGRDVADQWVRTNSLLLASGDTIAPPTTANATANGYATATTTYRQTSNNATVVQLVLVTDLGHAWPGGLAGGSYSDERGPDASRALWTFFSARTKSEAFPDAPPPGTETRDGGSDVTDPTPGDDAKSPGDAAVAPASEDGGCAVATTSSSRGFAGLALAALGAVVARARRKRR